MKSLVWDEKSSYSKVLWTMNATKKQADSTSAEWYKIVQLEYFTIDI
jgi:hypothetical protein